jgi:Skp family chaperone for outer membrane proteins
MNFRLKNAAAAILAASLVCSAAYAEDPAPPVKKHTTAKKAKTPPPPSVAEQIQALKQDLENQINGLKTDLADKDAQLKKAQQAAADAQTAADKANAAASAQQQAVTDNATAVTTLQTTVTDMKSGNALVVSSLTEEAAKIKTDIASPSALHYKGINITPGGYMAAETVWRSHATGGDIPTAFTAMPFGSADASKLSEFYGSGRQSRVSLMAEGKANWGTMRGYVEADFLSAGTNSNNNQSNSYVMRQRVVWAQAALNSGWTFTGGQMWSLATETKKGLSTLSGDVATPQAIDANYSAGFVWTRQYGFRVTKTIGTKAAVGIGIENPQTLAPAGTFNVNSGVTYLWGTPGAGGGNYNGGASTSNASCTTTASTTTPTTYTTTCIPSYLTTYSINEAPDVIVKAAFDPGWGHYEVFGIGRWFRDRIYPGASTTTSPAYNDIETGGGIGGGFRVPLFAKKLDFGVKGLYGVGVGRYANSTIADVTVRPDGTLSPLHNISGLGTLEYHATPRLDIYANYGGDYVGRSVWTNSNTTPKKDGYGWNESNSGCATEPLPTNSSTPAAPSNCSGVNRDVQEGTLGYWYDFYKGPKGRLRQSIQYSYAFREIWADKTGFAPKGIENMFWTSFRYYLP